GQRPAHGDADGHAHQARRLRGPHAGLRHRRAAAHGPGGAGQAGPASSAPAERERKEWLMANVYYEKDADAALVGGRKVAVIGYGSRGHAPARNLTAVVVCVRLGPR